MHRLDRLVRRTDSRPRARLRTAAAALAVAAGVAVASPVHAGPPPPDLGVDVFVNGPAAESVLDGLTIIVYEDDGSLTQIDPLNCTTPVRSGLTAFEFSDSTDCLLGPGDYQIGLQGVPEPFTAGGSCTSNNQGNGVVAPPNDLGLFWAFTVEGPVECDLYVNASVLLIDKVVVGGPAASADFTIQVLDDSDAVVASGNDVADATCADDFDTAECGIIAMPSGLGFTIAEPSVDDYELTSVECDQFVNAAWPPDGGAAPEPIGDDGFRTDDGDTYCVVTNTYVPPPTTTTTVAPTTTTTVAPTTTAAPTTVATTTTLFGAGGVLPETGPATETTGWLALTATALILAGSALLLVRRRAA